MTILALVGAGGHGKVVADLAEACGYAVIFFDESYPQKKFIEHWPIEGAFSDLLAQRNIYKNALVSIGNNSTRENLIKQLVQAGFNLPTLIHPTAVVSRYANIASGCVVFSQAVINAFAVVGKGCIINTGAIIEHDCVISDAVHISPNVSLAGGVIIGKNSWIGIGAAIKQQIEIGENVIVGAGSVIIKNTIDAVTVVGNPATPLIK